MTLSCSRWTLSPTGQDVCHCCIRKMWNSFKREKKGSLWATFIKQLHICSYCSYCVLASTGLIRFYCLPLVMPSSFSLIEIICVHTFNIIFSWIEKIQVNLFDCLLRRRYWKYSELGIDFCCWLCNSHPV